MDFDVCARVGYSIDDGKHYIRRACVRGLRLAGLLTGLDMSLGWLTARLDRQFLAAMERSVREDPARTKEMSVLKRTILVLMCIGLGMSALSMKFVTETQIVEALIR